MGRRKKSQDPIDIILGVIGIGILLVFMNRLSGQGFSSVDSVIGLLINSALSVLFYVILAGIVFWFASRLYLSSKEPDIELDFSNKVSHQSKLNPKAAPSNLFKGSPVLKKQADVAPDQWTEELITKAEWRVFEKICMALWSIKDFAVEETANGADGGVDFYLQANTTKKRIGAVQCKSWSSKQIGVGVIRELQGVIASEKLQLGLLMYSGKLSQAAIDFLAKPEVTVKAQNTSDIFKEIQKLEKHQQKSLLKEVIPSDYATPSCPNCDKKLMERKPRKGGKPFWGCSSFPRCRFTMQMSA